jgi:hypothetical protein
VAMISRSVVFMPGTLATHSDKTLAGERSGAVAAGAGVLAGDRLKPAPHQSAQVGGVGDDDHVPRVVAPDQAEVLESLEVAGEVL